MECLWDIRGGDTYSEGITILVLRSKAGTGAKDLTVTRRDVVAKAMHTDENSKREQELSGMLRFNNEKIRNWETLEWLENHEGRQELKLFRRRRGRRTFQWEQRSV